MIIIDAEYIGFEITRPDNLPVSLIVYAYESMYQHHKPRLILK